MKENKMLASVALFGELYDSKKNVYDVIGEFIKAAIISEAKWSFNSQDAKQLLEYIFDFEIPEAVIKLTLRNRLIKDNTITYSDGVYTYRPDLVKIGNNLSAEFEINKENYERIRQDLILYVESKSSKPLTQNEQDDLNKSFNSYLLDDGISDTDSQYISSFILNNQDRVGFAESLNAIKEGLVIYEGIRYTGDLNELGEWKSALTIFLDTEYLFHSAGYNGTLYETMFNDFYKLVQEINSKSLRSKGERKINLRYFEETKNEVDSFFYVAEKILDGKASLDPSKPAMIAILDGCKAPRDIVAKKTKFFTDLKTQGIIIEEKVEYYKDHTYNVLDPSVLEKIKKQIEENDRTYNEEECVAILNLFTKINVLRKGKSDTWFEKVGYVLMTGKGLAHFLAHNPIVKTNERDIPYASDVDFITDRFWFKLQKSFNDKDALPKSFDIITKAQVVLSYQINNSISKEYQRLTDSYKLGKISKENVISLNYELRERSSRPEDILKDSIDDSLAFLQESDFENHIREKSLLLKKVQDGEAAIAELSKIKFSALKKKKQSIKRNVGLRRNIRFLSAALLVLLIVGGLGLVTYFLRSNNDTSLSVFGIVITIVLGLIPFLRYKAFLHWLKKKSVDDYKNKVANQ